MSALRDRAEGTVIGLAVGDAAGWPAVRHRAAVLPPWTRRLRRELDAFGEEWGVSTPPVPFALNQPTGPLRLGPSDDAEWLAFTALHALTADADGGPDAASIAAAWLALAERDAGDAGGEPLHARISTRVALDNLAAGLHPPVSGHDNPHHFDDAAALRAPVFGVLAAGAPERAAELAALDAAVTNAGDGVHAARATAAAVAIAVAGGSVSATVAGALAQLPDGTAARRRTEQALVLASGGESPFALVPALDGELLSHVYSYGVAAADTLAIALALTVAADGDLTAAVPAAACLARSADAAPALTGALTGALGGAAAIPQRWRADAATLAGCCLPELAGTRLDDLARRLAERAAAVPPTTTTGPPP